METVKANKIKESLESQGALNVCIVKKKVPNSKDLEITHIQFSHWFGDTSLTVSLFEDDTDYIIKYKDIVIIKKVKLGDIIEKLNQYTIVETELIKTGFTSSIYQNVRFVKKRKRKSTKTNKKGRPKTIKES